MKTLLFFLMLFSIPVSLFRQDYNQLEERDETQIYSGESSETISTLIKFNIQITDTIKDSTHQLRLPKEALDNNPSIIYKMPIYVPDSSMNYFKKEPYEDLTSHKLGEVFFIVDTMPEFPGGETALKNFIAEHIKYPSNAKDDGIEGTVYVTFIIDKFGKVVEPRIARGVIPALDLEAIRVVESLPGWEPGKQNGVKVNVLYTLPVKFKLQHNIK